MSTKAIREALGLIEKARPVPRRVLYAARDEVEAIERASVVLADDAATFAIREEHGQKVQDALEVFQAIAEEVKS